MAELSNRCSVKVRPKKKSCLRLIGRIGRSAQLIREVSIYVSSWTCVTYSSKTETGRHGGGPLTGEVDHRDCAELRCNCKQCRRPDLPACSIFVMLTDRHANQWPAWGVVKQFCPNSPDLGKKDVWIPKETLFGWGGGRSQIQAGHSPFATFHLYRP